MGQHTEEIARLNAEIVDTVARMGDSRTEVKLGAKSVAHTTLMIDMWSLRLRVATLQMLNTARPDERLMAEQAMVTASREIAEHERRLAVARKGLDLDAKDEAEEHGRKQADVGSKFLALAEARRSRAG